MFWIFGHEACGVLAPWPGIDPTPPALEGKMLTLEHQGSPVPTHSSGSGSAISFSMEHNYFPLPSLGTHRIVAVPNIQYCVDSLSTRVDSERLEAKLMSTNPSIWVLEGSLKHLIWNNNNNNNNNTWFDWLNEAPLMVGLYFHP